MSNGERFTRTRLTRPGGCIGSLRASYVELVEAFGRPNVGLSGDRKTSMGWTLRDNVTGNLFQIYAFKATRDYEKRLPSRAALRRLPGWAVGCSTAPRSRRSSPGSSAGWSRSDGDLGDRESG